MEFKPWNKSQAEYVRTVAENVLTICVGPAGTGKSLVPCYLAAEGLLNNKITKVIITRPIIESGKGLGFLPGSLSEKTSVYMIPVMEELEKYLGKTNLDECLDDGTIEVVPPEYMRGRNFHRAFVICDEAQNMSFKQIKMLISRIGRESKMVINGDTDQCDLSDYESGALQLAYDNLGGVKDVGLHRFSYLDIVRNPIIGPILKRLDDAYILSKRPEWGDSK